MRSMFSEICIVLVVLLVSGQANQDFGSEELQQFIDRFFDAFNAKDLEDLMTYYSMEGRRMAPGQNTQVGYEAIKGAYKSYFESGVDVEFTNSLLVKMIYEGSDLAVAEFAVRKKLNGEATCNKNLFVFTREGKELKLLAAIWNKTS